MTWEEGLGDEQRAVAGSPRQDILLLAGPGTGKTFVLVRRIQYLVEEQNVDPRRITALTFTRATAAEMRERLEARLGDRGKRVRVSTLHSFALWELLRQGARGLPLPVRVAGDWEERWVVVEELARILHRPVRRISNPYRRDGALDLLGDDWDTLAADGSGWDKGHPDPEFLAAWQRHRQVYGYTLRSELVYQLLCELRSNPEFSPTAQSQVVVVDEYQDLNQCDLRTVRELVSRSEAEVFAAGDDDQSIYSFRHAHPAGIRSFGADYPGAARLTMTECLRCGADVIEIANWLIAQEQDREPKALRSVTEWPASVHLVRFPGQQAEAAGTARMIKAEIDAGLPPEEVLVLIRSDTGARISGAVRDKLADLGVEAYLPRDAAAIDDESVQRLLEYLILTARLREDKTDDLAVRALLQLEDNRIGKKRLRDATDLALDRSTRFLNALDHIAQHPTEFPRLVAVSDERDRIIERACGLAPEQGESFDAWLTRVCGQAGVQSDAFQRVYLATRSIVAEIEDALAARGDVGAENEVTAQSQMATDFVQELVLAMTNLGDTLPARIAGSVTVTTMHGAKGLSADLVIVLQAEDEVIPNGLEGTDYDESRRLLYVSLTRARRRLVVGACTQRTGPQRFAGREEVVQRSLTRFLRDYGLPGLTVAGYLKTI